MAGAGCALSLSIMPLPWGEVQTQPSRCWVLVEPGLSGEIYTREPPLYLVHLVVGGPHLDVGGLPNALSCLAAQANTVQSLEMGLQGSV